MTRKSRKGDVKQINLDWTLGLKLHPLAVLFRLFPIHTHKDVQIESSSRGEH